MGAAEELAKLADLHDRGVLSDDEFARLKAGVLSSNERHPRRRWPAVTGMLAAVAAVVGVVVYVVGGHDTGVARPAPTTVSSPAPSSAAVTVATSAASTSAPVSSQAAVSSVAVPATTIDVVTLRAALIGGALHSSGAIGWATFTVMGLSSRTPLWAPNRHSNADIAACALEASSSFLDLPGRVSAALDRLIAGGTPITRLGPLDVWAEVRYDRIDKIQQLQTYFVHVCAGFSDAQARSTAQL